MKSGSTSLSKLLDTDPNIFITKHKEPGFFSRDERYREGTNAYLKHFETSEPHQLTGEASTCYSRKAEFPLAAERLHEHNPECKLVYIMRDPVRRAYSDYSHRMANRIVTDESVMSYTDALSSIPQILDASNYFLQIENYLRFFSANQLHCIIFEELVNNPEEELTRLYNFFGLNKPSEISELSHHNEKGTKLANRESKAVIKQLSKYVPNIFKKIISEEKKEALRHRARTFLIAQKLSSSKDNLERIIDARSEQVDNMVFDELEASIENLEAFLDRGLDIWKEPYRV